MIETVVNKLSKVCQAHSLQLSVAESCTGGLVAKTITDLAGSSQWFERGFVTYTNLAKEQMLGVDKQLISEHGAVSEQVAAAMAKGALLNSQAQFSLSITGVAGPGGGTESKPVGLVCFGWARHAQKDKLLDNTYEIDVLTKVQKFSGDREAVRNQSAFFALQGLLELIKDHYPK
ncbi:MAG: CinA family protein [Gammaproteobacteria bacterium]|nr:CinA family protein [Gammaproteobacteria bacterium]